MTRKNDEPQIIGDIMLDNPALAAVLVKALQQRVKTVEKLVDHLLTERRTAARNSRSWDHGARIEKIEETQINSLFDAADGERARDLRIKKLEQRLTRIEGYLEAEMPPEDDEDHDEQDRMAFESEKIEQQGLEQ